VGRAIARRVLVRRPERLVIGGLREDEAREAVDDLRSLDASGDVEIVPEWGDLFLREEHDGRSRAELLTSAEGRRQVLDDLFGVLDEEAYRRSALCGLLERREPEIVVDCVNTATAIAYQDLFTTAEELRSEVDQRGSASAATVETHLSSLYLPQLIRHIQLLLEGMRRTGTELYLKIGTSGTGGMGLNVPFTHSEQRPSPTLLAKASIAGAHSLLLFLMARTPDAPVVKEIKPTAAIAWKEIAYGPVGRGDRTLKRVDARDPLPLEEAFGTEISASWTTTDEPLESVYLDAGENGLFSLGEFETISALRMMEIVTPEEIAETVLGEIEGRPTGKEIVGALNGASFGPTYRAGVMREAALRRMEELEREHDVRSVAFEMLGPPRLSKLLFEASLLRRLLSGVEAASRLDPGTTATRAEELVRGDRRLRSDILSIGLPILLSDGTRLLRGPRVEVEPDPGAVDVDRWAHRGWVDLRPSAWERWAERCASYVEAHIRTAGSDAGSVSDLDVRARTGEIRPGALAAHVFRTEDEGERIMR
jgi:hypothetical protein